MPEAPKFSLCPLLLVHGNRSREISLLHFLPVPITWHARWLTRLAAVPFTTFRFFPQSAGATYPLDLWVDGTPIPFPAREFLRPVVIWSTDDSVEEVVKFWLGGRAIFVELVSERRELVTRLAERFGGPQFTAVAVDDADHPSGIAANAPALIWRGYLHAINEVLRGAGGGTSPFTALEALAERDCFTPEGAYWQARPVPDDFVVSPARIIRNNVAGRLSAFPPSESTKDAAYAIAAGDAAEALVLRGLGNIIHALRIAAREDVEELVHQFGIGDEWVAWIQAARRGEAGPPPAAEPPAAFRRFAPPQAVLLCTTTSNEARERAGVGRAEGKPLSDSDEAYADKLLEAMLGGGRMAALPAASNAREEELLQGFSYMVRGENEAYSAIALLHAGRFGAPVLKVPALGAAVLDEFRAVNRILETSTAQNELALTQADSQRLATAVAQLSSTLTEQIPAPTRDFLLSLEHEHLGTPPLVHAFSDVPLEFLRIGDDYLGYSADLSRTPLTPGTLPFINYAQTELTTVLPTKAEEFLIVTPFADDPFFEAVLQNQPPYVPDYRQRLIRTRDHLFDALHDEAVRCLVYFGHGLWDSEERSSALVLRGSLFTTRHVNALERVPPVVILIGCNTAAAGAVLGGFHAALFERGAQLIVGTSFPVPRYIGAILLRMSINNILSPGVDLADGGWEPYRDLGQIMAVVRRRIRCQSDLYALWSEGRIDQEQMERGMNRYIELLSEVPQMSADDRYQFELEKQVLVELGVLAETSPLIDCGATPYPLFFQTLGFPWTARSESWIT